MTNRAHVEKPFKKRWLKRNLNNNNRTEKSFKSDEKKISRIKLNSRNAYPLNVENKHRQIQLDLTSNDHNFSKMHFKSYF
jgi:hypothetical protein